MSEAELYVIRARLNGGIRNKAERGELRRGLPVGFVYGEEEGKVRFHPDEAVVTAIRNIFDRFAETGLARRVWRWFREEEDSTADAPRRQSPLGRCELHGYPPCGHQPRLCRRLRLWQNAQGDDEASTATSYVCSPQFVLLAQP